MADSNLFKPTTSPGAFGKKKMDDGQFSNPPAYPDMSGFSGPSVIDPEDRNVNQLEKSPGARKGRV